MPRHFTRLLLQQTQVSGVFLMLMLAKTSRATLGSDGFLAWLRGGFGQGSGSHSAEQGAKQPTRLALVRHMSSRRHEHCVPGHSKGQLQSAAEPPEEPAAVPEARSIVSLR